jgi:hypothetical protein
MDEDLYLVTWSIMIEASSPRDAAEKALEIQRDPASLATVFVVDNGEADTEVDLLEGSLR